MPTPDSIRAQYHLPTDYAPGSALVEVVFTNPRISEFHKRAGVAVIAALNAHSSRMEDVVHAIVFTDPSSPYLEAIKSIQQIEAQGLLEEGSTGAAFAELHRATFDTSEWVEFLPEDEL